MLEDMRTKIKISVRDLVEFIFRSGDIDNRGGGFATVETMLMGSRTHRKIQNSYQKEVYQAEVPLKTEVDFGKYDLIVEGRADGILKKEIIYIDEIKGTYLELDKLEEPIFVHKAQAMCYAYIYAMQNDLDDIGVQMTYCNMESEVTKSFEYKYKKEEIYDWFTETVEKYRKWSDFIYEWRKIRRKTIQKLDFPFEYREGQKKLVEDVYKTIIRKKMLFMQAPTGVGKTISTIFPAVKAIGEGQAEKIFYLTAKTITASVAYDTFELLEKNGYKSKTLLMTAKEKMCLCDEMDCNPIACPYAKGHFDRVNDAVYSILKEKDFFTREALKEHAENFQVCPFEMQLDLSNWCDNVVCDYNYVFDPNVKLKRFFQEGIKRDYIFLIDEAHNLVERSRKMYSASLIKEDVLKARLFFKNASKKIYKQLDKINKVMLQYKRKCEGYHIFDDVSELYFPITRVLGYMEEFLKEYKSNLYRKEILEFYFKLRNFINIYEIADSHYEIYGQITENNQFELKLFCVDPSLNIQKCIDRGKAAILFSATFLPINYYKSMLSTRDDNYAIYAHSVFKPSQNCIMIGNDVSSRYKDRTPYQFRKIAEYIKKTVASKKGNYMIFFPSYLMLENVLEYFNKSKACEYCDVLVQKNSMTEVEREEFLEEFSVDREKSLAAFCIMGGIFGEGIDLKNDKLIGTIIIGTGYPQVSTEQNILKNYYDEKSHNGFDFAYRYPGINKVLQAAGRVIRTVDDYGVIELLDSRFMQKDFDNLFPIEWKDIKVVNINNMEKVVDEFWKKYN